MSARLHSDRIIAVEDQTFWRYKILILPKS